MILCVCVSNSGGLNSFRVAASLHLLSQESFRWRLRKLMIIFIDFLNTIYCVKFVPSRLQQNLHKTGTTENN